MKPTFDLIEEVRIARLYDPLRAAVAEMELHRRVGILADDPREHWPFDWPEYSIDPADDPRSCGDSISPRAA